LNVNQNGLLEPDIGVDDKPKQEPEVGVGDEHQRKLELVMTIMRSNRIIRIAII